MGQAKQLLLLGDKPIVRHCVDTLLDAGVEDIVVVAGDEKYRIAHALHGLPVTIAVNLALESDMAVSVRVGLEACDLRSSGMLVCLADHPLVQPETCQTLVRLHHEAPEKIIIPTFKGKRGHPGLFPAEIIHEIYVKTSLSDIVREDPDRVLTVDVEDEGVVLDMDTESDYNIIKDLYDARESMQPYGSCE